MTRYTSCLIICLFAVGMVPASGDENSAQLHQAILDQHNYYRDIAGIKLMKWNEKLAARAQLWAVTLKNENNCKSKHSDKNFRSNQAGFRYIGENLYWRYWSKPFDNSTEYTKDAATKWYEEIRDYQYSPNGICPKRAKKQAVGHFTQLMWNDSTNLGCGYAQCDGKTSLIIVCQYGPGGNVNISKTPPFSEAAAKRLNEHPVNKKFDGLPTCRRMQDIKINLDIPRPAR